MTNTCLYYIIKKNKRSELLFVIIDVVLDYHIGKRDDIASYVLFLGIRVYESSILAAVERIRQVNGRVREMSRREKALTRRQQVLYQRIAVCFITACIIIFSVLLGSSIIAAGKSKASDEYTSFKYYTSIEVEKGDTLWSIANEYMSAEYDSVQAYIDEVKELNRLGADDIHSGQYLMIPYYSAEFQ